MKNILQTQSTRNEQIYIIAFSLYLFQSFVTTTMFTAIIPSLFLTFIKWFAVILVFIKIFMEKYSSKQFIIISITSILIIISALVSTYNNLCIFLIFIIGAYNIPLKKIVKTYFYLCLMLLIITMISAKLGIIEDLIYIRNGKSRNSFGIVYPTDFAAHVFFLMVAYIYLKGKNINLYNYLTLILISLLVYFFCYTRLDVACMVLLIIISIIYKKNKLNFNNKLIKFLLVFSFSICAFIALFLTFNYDYKNETYAKIDQFMSGRLTIGRMMLNQYDIKLFGQEINDYGYGGSLTFKHNTYNYIDCSYLRILLKYGLVTFSILIVLNVFYYHKLYVNGNYMLLLLMLLVAINSIIAQHYLDFSYNFLLLAYLTKVEDNC